ncbi:MAG TPA: efflux RND transporter periplasmic adaptor subunit [Gemmatimonadaceae bacterium]|nr:efflux RND transporter periplasmic adaptor subunit [Gemmatimonadaceae bacterium]HUK21619.1 efflux RND transporter periplasmic adaptor subunit [Gemmatimonadales bacterium]
MEVKNADLSALRINRTDASPVPGAGASGGRARWILLAVGIVAVLAAIAVMASRFAAATEVHLTPATLISPARAQSALVASGYVVAQRKAAVASKGTGRLVYLGVVEGDRVKSGQIIARLEDSDVRAQLAQAEANLDLSRADLHNAERSLARMRLLHDSNFTTLAGVDSAEARYLQVKSGIAVAEATVQAAQVALENTVIRAPFDGTVLSKDADVGEVVAPLAASAFSKAAVVTIADLRSLEVEADVSEANLEAITVGQPCEIVLDAYPDVRYPAYVSKIVPTADRAKATVLVKVAFRSYDARVLPEMSAKAHFLPRQDSTASGEGTAPDTTPVLVVPSSAVTERNSRSVVYTVDNNRAVEVPVTLGRRFGSSVAIAQGIGSGTMVIDSIDTRLRPGTKVKIR